MIASGGAVIGRLRVRTADADRDTVGLRVRAMISTLNLHPAGLPTAAVLVIGRLADPLPGDLRTDVSGPVSPAWRHSMAETLNRALREAARPAAGPVPADSSAILFADRSELLASLASDWLAGTLWTRWWWRSLMLSEPDTMLRCWRQEPVYVPAAFEALAARGEAVPFARSIPEQVALSLAVAVAAVHGIQDADGITGSPGSSGWVMPRARAGRLRSPGGEPPDRWPPEARGEYLQPGQRVLLATSLLLRREPIMARRPGFMAAARQQFERMGPSASESCRSGERLARTAAPVEVGAFEPERTDPAAAAASGHKADQELPAAVIQALASGVWSGLAAAAASGGAARRQDAAGIRFPPERATQASAATDDAVSRRPAGPPSALAHDTPTAGQGIATTAAPDPSGATPGGRPAPGRRPEVVDTRLGGLFYLINLGQGLGLYGDFTTPLSPGIGLDLWDFVWLLGRRLLGRPVPSDPVWELLAGLAGRAASQPPGRGFAPPEAWRVPDDWLGPFDPAGEWRWSAAGGRLRVQHPAGFAVLDVPRDDRAAPDQLREELQPLGVPAGAPPRRRSLPPLPARPLHRWVALLGAYATARLSRALDHPAGRVGEVLLRHRARVFVTHVHVDVTLSLAELPIEIRLVGLDRDPGWVPAAGRVVAFRFD